jgi:SAM-dependent methyltransferase
MNFDNNSFETKYLSGNELYGDDFSDAEVAKWHKDEEEAYFRLSNTRPSIRPKYQYHSLNAVCGFSQLKAVTFNRILGFGSAYGDELLPIAGQAREVHILEPSSNFQSQTLLDGTPCQYHKPTKNGILPFDANYFDVVTCFGVLHHIPNVTSCLKELFRVTSPNGHVLLREPIVSMGDWRRQRKGLTPRERGLPVQLLRDATKLSGFQIESDGFCSFAPTRVLASALGIGYFNSHLLTRLDRLLAGAFSFNYRYHRKTLTDRFAPDSIFLVLKKH